jgi:hypothetical protein
MVTSGAAPAHQTEEPSGTRWTALQRWAFRVVFIYFTLDALPDLLLRLPGRRFGGQFLLVLYWKIWNPILPWFGHHILHARNPGSLSLPTGPILLGDFAGGYVLMLLFLLLGFLVATLWTVADQRRGDYRTLHYWLRVYVRYALACSMLEYALGKLFPLQFAPPARLVDFLTPMGMLEPRQLLWAFMGFSRPYQVFTGLVECVGLALLFWRRTTLLGSLLLIGALGNVLMIDIGYGMAVRRIALRLLLMAVFLAAPDLRTMANFFLRHLPVTPGDIEGQSWKGVWTRRFALALKTAVILYIVIPQLIQDSNDPRLLTPPRPALYGVYKVQRFLRNGQEGSPDDSRAWQWIAVDERGLAVQLSGVNWERLAAVFDDAKQSITISSGARRKPGVAGVERNSLAYSRTGPDDVLVKGVLDDQPTEVLLHRVPEPRFPLNDPLAMHWPSVW